MRTDPFRHGKRKPRKVSRVILSGAAAVAFLALLFLGYRYFFPAVPPPDFNAAFPGSMTADLTYESSKTAMELKDGFEENLLRSSGAAEYYQIAGQTGTPAAVFSGYLLFEDQVDLLGFYAEQKERSAYNRLNDWIKAAYKAENGLFVKRVVSETLEKPEGDLEVRVSDQIRYCRVLIEAYERFGQERDLELARDLSDRLLPLCKDNSLPPPEMTIALPAATPTPDFTATPAPKPSAVPTIDPSQITYIGAIDLSTIDLYALQLLSVLDGDWEAVYRTSLDLIRNGAITQPAPLFQAGYNVQKSGYVPYLTETAEFILEDQMEIALHLAEVSMLPESTFAYLKQLLFNTNTYYETYDILTAKSTSSSESIAGYAYMARIARILQDKELYDLCIGRIGWNTADSVTSDIFGLPFRTMEDSTIRAYSKDAVGALKAYY